MKQYTIKIHVSVVAGMLGFEMWKNVKRRRRLGFEAGISEHMSVHKEKRKSTTGLEPAISRFVGGRLIHWATRTHLTVIYLHTPVHTLMPSFLSTSKRIITQKVLSRYYYNTLFLHNGVVRNPFTNPTSPVIILLYSGPEKRFSPTYRLNSGRSV